MSTDTVEFDGGSDADRRELLAVHHGFLAANDPLDPAMLRKVWDDEPGRVFFNTNGHTYHGIDDWLKVWDYYRVRFRLIRPYGPGHIRIAVRGDMAMIAADGVSRTKEWVGKPEEIHNPKRYRATQVCIRTDGKWKVVHAHFSEQDEGVRPDKQG
jgi:ketosteroid isomerase-like protein